MLSISLIVGGAFMIAFDPDRVFQAQAEIFDDSAEATGTIGVTTILKDSEGKTIREYEPTNILTGALLDPATDTEVATYIIRCSWSATGTNVKWNTLQVTGEASFVAYVGVGFYGQAKEQTAFDPIIIGSKSLTADADGNMDFIADDLEAFIPNTLPDIEWTEDPVTGVLQRHGVSVPQKGTEAHSLILVFEGTFGLSVYDMAGNHLASDFDLRVELKLLWPGSAFEVTWDGDGEIPAETETVEEITPPAEATAEEDYTVDQTDYSVDISTTNLESDEFIRITETKEEDLLMGSIFGGGASEDVGLLLVACGVGLLVLTVFGPKFNWPIGKRG